MRQAITIICLIISSSALTQTYEVYNGDTINYSDIQNRKQGLWIRFNNNGDKLLEQGKYISDQKDGAWISYFPSGNIKHKITYKNGKAIGPAQFYYDNGIISEEGVWHIDHWQGNYKYYNKNGRLAYDWHYDNAGNRTGTQKYYHENGVLKYDGVWANGKATGTLKIYDEKGKLVTERVYHNGEFMENVAITENITTEEVAPQQSIEIKEYNTFNGTGNHVVYTRHGMVEKQGFFLNGKIFTGKHCFYNSDNQLIKVIHYQNGKAVKTEER
ncbi:toxin-antitoxin system YwqK family antitoxin [Carboxylicivirga taeanensis]|uniref:toxin-antitoxin system YwqK family antitoxin n=1 Tax=Carboxylicivirga taeanensis TaxID=1416875 RepID=UPI003F6DF45E